MPAGSSRISLIKSEYRVFKNSDSTTLTRWPASDIFKLNTFFNVESDANTLGTAILALRKEPRSSWTLVVSDRYRFSIVLGQTYTIVHPRFGLSAGKNFIVRGIKQGSNSRTVELILFGPQ